MRVYVKFWHDYDPNKERYSFVAAVFKNPEKTISIDRIEGERQDFDDKYIYVGFNDSWYERKGKIIKFYSGTYTHEAPEDAINDFIKAGMLSTCSECGKLNAISSMFKDEDGNDYCSFCATNIGMCAHCCTVIPKPAKILPYYTRLCKRCAEADLDPHCSDCVEGYHDFKDSGMVNFCGEEKRANSPYLGFELEVDQGGENPSCLYRLNDIFYTFFHYEHDGSLDEGFEIISQPASIEFLNSKVEDFTQLMRILRSDGYNSHDAGTCGLHVHIDKTFFGANEKEIDYASAKMIYLFNKFWEPLCKFSRRNSDQAGQWAAKYGRSLPEIFKRKKRGELNRYFAVNLTNPSTIEIRLWRGTLNLNTFMATLNLTANIARIVKEKTASEIHEMRFEDLFCDNQIIKNYWATRN